MVMISTLTEHTIKKFGALPMLIASGMVVVFGSVLTHYVYHSGLSLGTDFVTQELVPMVIKLLRENQFCQAVVFSSASASFFYLLHLVYRSLILPLFDGYTSCVTIHNTDPNFNAVIDYLSDEILSKIEGAQSSLQASTKEKKWSRKDWIQDWLGTGSRTVDKFEFRPDSDKTIHKLKYKGRTIMMTRSKSSDPLMGGGDKPFTVGVGPRQFDFEGPAGDSFATPLQARVRKFPAHIHSIKLLLAGWLGTCDDEEVETSRFSDPGPRRHGHPHQGRASLPREQQMVCGQRDSLSTWLPFVRPSGMRQDVLRSGFSGRIASGHLYVESDAQWNERQLTSRIPSGRTVQQYNRLRRCRCYIRGERNHR